MKPAFVVLIASVLTVGCGGPSCEDQGGRSEFSHFQPIIITTGKTTTTQLIPVYKCVMPR